LPLSMQSKLLRALEERKVLRIGARAEREIDVRFVAATNRDPEVEIERGTFRQDLYFRLNGISLTIPPLRERKIEIPHLARMFLARARAEQAAPPLAISEAALAALTSYAWPGNVRELKNVIERGSVLCQGDRLLPEHLPPKLLARNTPRGFDSEPPRAEAGTGSARPSDGPPARPIDPAARKEILDALERTAGNQTRAAELLGISRRTLVTRLTEFDIPRPRKR